MAWVVDTCLLIDVAEADPGGLIDCLEDIDTDAPPASTG
jgi:hypothetical protein